MMMEVTKKDKAMLRSPNLGNLEGLMMILSYKFVYKNYLNRGGRS